MKFIYLIIFFVGINCFGQIKFLVIAENGLLLREEPNSKSKIIGELYFGAEVEIISNTGISHTIIEGEKKIEGLWVKVKFTNFPINISANESGYLFSAYLKDKTSVINEVEKKLDSFSELKKYTISSRKKPFHIIGDFFGDGVNDHVLLVSDEEKRNKIVFINYGSQTKIHILGNEADPFDIEDYGWVGIFKRVNKNEPLWSNYEDDFISFEEVPNNKIIKLNYNALYVHASESCGGGFIYWKNGQFNWLQQE